MSPEWSVPGDGTGEATLTVPEQTNYDDRLIYMYTIDSIVNCFDSIDNKLLQPPRADSARNRVSPR